MRQTLAFSTLRRWRACARLVACLAAGIDAVAAAPVPAIDSYLDRDFGVVMGSVLRQTIHLRAEADEALESSLLPPAGSAINDWLEIRSTAWREATADGVRNYRIEIDYQVFKGVRQAEFLTIPAVSLSLNRRGETVTVEAPPLPFTLNPLIPPDTADEAASLRPLHPPPALPAASHGARLALWFLALAALLLYAARYLGLPPFRRTDGRPFAAAARELRRLCKGPGSPQATREAWRTFHGALNRYAGRTVLESQLPDLIAAHPELSEVQGELAALFEVSHRLFFIPGEERAAVDFPLSRLEDLCRRCGRIERKLP